MEERVVSAPGKIILAGEHAVVYGQPAIVAAIDRRLSVTVKSSKTKRKYSGLVQFALKLLQGPTLKEKLPNRVGPYGLAVEIASDLPIGSGLGSSAALATALVWALKPQVSEEEKNKLVKVIEDYQHGKSSGVDQAIVREGGFLKFKQGKFQPIKLSINQAILIDSGQPQESTGEMVRLVAKKNYSKEFIKIGELVDKWQPALIKENEKLLEKIGVVGKKARVMVCQVESIGGVAKICGGGGVKAGSGMLLSYHHDQKKLLQLIKQSKWRYLQVKLGMPGVRYETD